MAQVFYFGTTKARALDVRAKKDDCHYCWMRTWRWIILVLLKRCPYCLRKVYAFYGHYPCKSYDEYGYRHYDSAIDDVYLEWMCDHGKNEGYTPLASKYQGTKRH